MSFSPLRTTLPCLALVLAACSSSSSSNTDANTSGGGNAPNNNATQGGNTANNGGNGTRDSGRPRDGGAPGSDAGTVPPACSAATAPNPGKLFLEAVGSVENELVMAAQPPGSPDWYLVRRRGYIDVLTPSGPRAGFLDLSGEIEAQNEGGERGLLGLTFHPDYATNGLFYVMVTPTQGANVNADVVREYKRSAADAYKAEPTKIRDIVLVPISQGNHNGGTVMFGPDKLMYVGTGDGGGGCNDDKTDAPQDVNSLYGKILRLDLTKPAPFAADGNPFANEGANASLVLHYGLRNPFRFGFDRATGDMYIGDVGQHDFEDIEFAPKGSKGLNFGWADFEGKASETCDANRKLRANSVHTPPIYSADRKGNTTPAFKDYISVIGGFVYRGTAIPKLQGMYFFGDYRGSRMGTLYQCGSTTSPITPINKACDINAPNEACFEAKGTAEDLNELFAIIEGNDREMYIVGNRKTLYKVVAN